jgi:hypothetical protein
MIIIGGLVFLAVVVATLSITLPIVLRKTGGQMNNNNNSSNTTTSSVSNNTTSMYDLYN